MYRFYKEDNRWYIDLPEFIAAGGDKESLEMIFGADEFLENLSNGKDEVFCSIYPSAAFDGPGEKIVFYRSTNNLSSGAFYYSQPVDRNGHAHTSFVMWLCDVTKFVFDGIFPYMITIRQITKEQFNQFLPQTEDMKRDGFCEDCRNESV